MKKYLLMAMMVLGATGAFAGVEGTDTNVELPIYAQGEVVSSSSTNLIIEATSATMSGKEMTFDFGSISGKANSTSEVRTGNFRVVRGDGSAIFTGSGSAKIGFDSTGENKSTSGTPITDLTINYAVGYGSPKADETEINGKVTAQAVVGGSGISTGQSFNDSQKLYVVVTKS